MLTLSTKAITVQQPPPQRSVQQMPPAHEKLPFWQPATLQKALESVAGVWRGEMPSVAMSGRISTDTRTLAPGDVFLALVGGNFDGHNYVKQAQECGAALLITQRRVDSSLPQLMVQNSKRALGLLGQYRRRHCPGLKVVAITGSSGKTTVKNMLASILSQMAPTLATDGNLNNDLGVPLTLLNLSDEHRFLVIELGANHIGEIAYSTRLACPDVACVLNIGTAHLGEFGGRDAIAAAKAEIFQGLNWQESDGQALSTKRLGVAVLPIADDYFAFLETAAAPFAKNIISVGQSDGDCCKGDFWASDVALGAHGSDFVLHYQQKVWAVHLPLPGMHNVQNALMAAAGAVALGVDGQTIANGLRHVPSAQGRLNRLTWGQHCLIDDTYNANAQAVLAAASVLMLEPGQKILVLGDIGELGERAAQVHFALGEHLADFALDGVLAVGMHTAQTVAALQALGKNALHFADKESLLAALKNRLNIPSAVLFKGSRSAQMETLIEQLTHSPTQSA